MSSFPQILLGDMSWQTLTIPAAGILVTLLVLGAGFYFVSKRKPKAETLETVPSVDPFLQGAASERRQSPRRGGQSIRVTIQLVNDEKTVFDGYVLDRSMGGLRLMVDCVLNINQMLNVRSADAPQTVTWVQVQVRRVKQLPDKTYEIGCQFLRTPPWAILLTFG